MLKALARWILREEPEKTQRKREQPADDWVSRAEFESEMQKLRDRVEWDLSEWYDKFSTLHARTAKRAQRAKNGAEQHEQEPEQRPPLPSVLNFRKPWSV